MPERETLRVIELLEGALSIDPALTVADMLRVMRKAAGLGPAPAVTDPRASHGAPAILDLIQEHGAVRIDGSLMTEEQLANWLQMMRVTLKFVYGMHTVERGDLLAQHEFATAKFDGVPTVAPVWLPNFEARP